MEVGQNNLTYKVTFTGGLGAQIFSTSAYFFLLKRGAQVLADFSYFDQIPQRAPKGQVGAVSVWGFALEPFGFTPSDFRTFSGVERDGSHKIVNDGLLKLQLAQRGFETLEIRKLFNIPEKFMRLAENYLVQPTLAMHIRRGDYVNVSAPLIDYEQYLHVALSFKAIVKNIIIVTDEEVPNDVIEKLSGSGLNVTLLVNEDEFLSHCVLRKASILLAANSQFSYTAALLRDPFSITMFPKLHSNRGPNESGNRFLGSIEGFTLTTKTPLL